MKFRLELAPNFGHSQHNAGWPTGGRFVVRPSWQFGDQNRLRCFIRNAYQITSYEHGMPVANAAT